jgi:hypothetical protein
MDPQEKTLATPLAAFAGWVALAPINMGAGVMRTGRAGAGSATWLTAQAYGVGHLVVGGLLSAGILAAWLRFRPHRLRWLDLPALGVFAGVLGWFAVGPDFESFVERVASMKGVPPGALGAASTTVSIGGAVLVARAVARRLAPAALIAAAAVGLANHFVLELDYPGIHLIAGWSAVIAATFGLAALHLKLLQPSRRATIVLVALAPLAVASVVTRPGDAAWRRLLEEPGAFVAPYVSKFTLQRPVPTVAEDKNDPWMRSRVGAPPTPPSRLSSVPADGHVVLVMIDALRADVARRGATKVDMPNLERLRSRSVEFTQVRSVASSTVSCITTLFSGRFYSQMDTRLDATPRVPELLDAAGVSAFHVVPTRLLEPRNGATRGFRTVQLREQAPSSEVLPVLEKHLARTKRGRHLVYLHWMDAHSPYDLGGTEGSAWDAYLREVAIVDQRLGELVEMLERRRIADRTTLIVTADHGEAFGEHQSWEHGKTVYEELLHVPLLIASPGKPPGVVDARVSLVDVGATILDLFDEPVPGEFMGESLLPLAYGGAKGVSHPIVAEAGHKLRAFYSGDDVKVIFDLARRTTEVYDLAGDPGELRNIADARTMKKHIQRARRYFRAHAAKKE